MHGFHLYPISYPLITRVYFTYIPLNIISIRFHHHLIFIDSMGIPWHILGVYIFLHSPYIDLIYGIGTSNLGSWNGQWLIGASALNLCQGAALIQSSQPELGLGPGVGPWWPLGAWRFSIEAAVESSWTVDKCGWNDVDSIFFDSWRLMKRIVLYCQSNFS